ncbi:Inhibitor of growth protein 3-like protein [Leptotrombidium deliense]|uniref:Inhibitor of growth protein 3-like protein n=1 Tax=Leptotrombidium deliense TaxID=299467 RepID=A0A443SUE8_9ACAR|nr:Inhibitor of growth protein 3-like protein [Leptotrombidium deliense]
MQCVSFFFIRILFLFSDAMDSLDEQVKVFFANVKRMKPEQKEAEYQRIKHEYVKTLEDAEEKVHIANQIYELVEKYLKRLDQELQKFKIELEADNAGITEILEKRSLELDNPPLPVVNNVKERRKQHSLQNNISAVSNVTTTSIPIVKDPVTIGASTGYVTNNMGSSRSNGTFTPLSALVSATSNNTNGNLLLSTSLTNSSVTPVSCPTANSTTVLSHPNPLGYIGAGHNAIAAAASQAIAATQQMQQGRRTASLKASYEAINAGLPTISCDFNTFREGGIPPSTVNTAFLNNGEGPSSGLHRATKRSRTSSHLHDTGTVAENRSECKQFVSQTILQKGTENSVNGVSIQMNLFTVSVIKSHMEIWLLVITTMYVFLIFFICVSLFCVQCEREWFHYGCVGITQPPKGKWYCPTCTALLQMKKKNRKEKS